MNSQDRRPDADRCAANPENVARELIAGLTVKLSDDANWDSGVSCWRLELAGCHLSLIGAFNISRRDARDRVHLPFIRQSLPSLSDRRRVKSQSY